MAVMMMRSLGISALSSILFLTALQARSTAYGSTPDRLKSQNPVTTPNATIGNKIGDHTFIDQDGKPFRLQETLGKPLIVSFVYTSCPHACSLITSSLSSAVANVSKEMGKDFRVVTIGFDVVHDTPVRMREFGLRFTDQFDQWKFLSADRETIEKITREIGFYYEADEEDGFTHMSMVTLVDKQGKIYKHVLGQTFKPNEIRSSLQEILSGKSAGAASKWENLANPNLSVVEKLKLLCSRYNPATGTYEIYYPYFVVVAIQGILILASIPLIWGKELSRLVSNTFKTIRLQRARTRLQ